MAFTKGLRLFVIYREGRVPMSRAKPKSDLFRDITSMVLTVVLTAIVLVFVHFATDLDYTEPDQLLITIYVLSWPLYTALYVGRSFRVYSRLDPISLQQATAEDDRAERRLLPRLLGGSGATASTISAAALAVVVTILIARRPEIRSDPVYIVAALTTVASSWVLLVFSFAQSYLRLGSALDQPAHFKFSFPETARFSDYVTLAVLVSTMAATVPAEITSRRAWRLVRANVIIAFVFNSVIIAMMVSLLFGGLLA
jgi:uncharacterized membrane protein